MLVFGGVIGFQSSSHAFFRLLGAKLPQRTVVCSLADKVIKWIYLCLDDNCLVFPTKHPETLSVNLEERQASDQIVEANISKGFKGFLKHIWSVSCSCWVINSCPEQRRVQQCPEMPHLRILKVSWVNQTLCSALRWVSERWTAGMTGFHSNWIHEELVGVKHNLAGNNLTCPYI